MPLIVTDADVLAQIASDDSLAASIDAQFGKLANVPAATLAAWKARLAGYTTWAAAAKDSLSGGFLGGAWFGVPELGNQAIAWGDEFGAGTAGGTGWQTIVNQIAAGHAPTAVAASPVSQQAVADQNASVAPLIPQVDTSSKILVGVALGLVALMIFKK